MSAASQLQHEMVQSNEDEAFVVPIILLPGCEALKPLK